MANPPASRDPAKAIEERLTTRFLGRQLELRESVGSTMEEARRWIQEGATPGSVILSRQQTAGRGRQGRRFVSPEGGLYLTAILHPLNELQDSWRIGFAAAVACRRAILDCGGPGVLFDWPNDLIHRGRKVGGILLDLLTPLEGPDRVLLGIGLNIGPDPRETDPGQAGPAGPLELDTGEDPLPGVTACLLSHLEPLLDLLGAPHGWKDVLELVQAESTAGRGLLLRIRRSDGGIVEGRGQGIREDGAVLLKLASGEVLAIRYGQRLWPGSAGPTAGG